MKRDVKQIVERFAAAIAATNMHTPEDMRKAAVVIRSEAFSADDYDGERVAIIAYADLLEKRAERKDRANRAAFSK